MKRSGWILIGLAVLALLWVGREHFDATSYADVLARDTGESTAYACPPGQPNCAWAAPTGSTGAAPPPSSSSPATTVPSTPIVAGPTGPVQPPAPSGTGMQSAPIAAFSGTTTGGSSTSSAGPNSGGSSGNLFGPEYAGVDPNATGTVVSGRQRKYPTLIGPKDSGSTMLEGVGIVAPSQNYALAQSGQLPGAGSLGLVGSSRQPGDMDLIPDPYRVSQSYSASSYSSKTEPVPFLSDFSAFTK